MKNFNTAPEGPSRPVVETVEIGFEHTVDDGVIHYALDGAGNPVPRTYDVNTAPTPREVLARTAVLSDDALKELTTAFMSGDGGEIIAAMFGVLAKVSGDWVNTVADDPTVDPAQASELVGWLIDVYGLGEIVQLAAFLATAADTPTPDDSDADGGDDAPFDEAG